MTSRLALPLLLLFLAACSGSKSDLAPARRGHTFAIGSEHFLLDDRPFVLRAGEIHPARVPREYWRHRLEMVRAMGCNAVTTSLFWNQHEPRPGEFTFEGQADVAEFCRIAQDVGLWVILRPGPYACGEWDLGGLPWWLLKENRTALRSRDPRFLEAVERWLARVGEELGPLQITRGGPILMAQVENEYGSYGKDKEYLGALRDLFWKSGFDVPLYTCDGPSQLANGSRDDLFSAVNFGGAPAPAFEALRRVRPNGPLMCGEFYPGWFDSWGKPHHTGKLGALLDNLGAMLEERQSFSLHMVHGGTSFGFSAGANSPPFSPQTTSYDCDAPIDEAGRATPKYHALRELFAKHLEPGERLPPVPAAKPVQAVTPFRLTEAAPFLTQLGEPLRAPAPETFEELDLPHGCVLYRAKLPAGGAATLKLFDVHDVAWVFVDGKRVETLDRRKGKASVKLGARAADAELGILVEAMGRVHYGPHLHDRKGLTDRVELVDDGGRRELGPWREHLFPFDREQLEDFAYAPAKDPLGVPAVYRGRLVLERAEDTFLDMRGWSKGMVWVNGHALGRYWRIGPQQTLYLPGCWLKRGANEVLVLDVDGNTTTLELRGLAEPILDRHQDDVNAAPRLRKRGQDIVLASSTPVVEDAFADGPQEQRVAFPATKGRYVALVARTAHGEEPFASCAELYLLGPGGVELSRSNWNVIWADSEELDAEPGSALHVIDGDPETIWQTEWSAAKPAHPHVVVLDLGEEVALAGLRYLPRRTGSDGRIRQWALYVSRDPFPGL
jgi:beta-galactosidase